MIPQFSKIKFAVTRVKAPLYKIDDIVRAQPMVFGRRKYKKGKRTMMEELVVKKADLLEIVKKNREQHRKVFEEALEGYQNAVIKHLQDMLKKAKQGLKLDLRIHLVQPQDQTKDYDRVIKALEMSTKEEIEMDEREFAQYVMDDWDWSNQFWTNNSIYSAFAMEESKKRKLL